VEFAVFDLPTSALKHKSWGKDILSVLGTSAIAIHYQQRKSLEDFVEERHKGTEGQRHKVRRENTEAGDHVRKSACIVDASIMTGWLYTDF